MHIARCSPRGHAALTDPSRRAEAFLGFAIHLAAYVVGAVAMIAINLVFWSGYFWAVWPILGWGIGVVSHGAGVARMVFHMLTREGPAGAPGRLASLPGGSQAAPVPLPEEEWSRALRRIENLEAIVTSVEWDEGGRFDQGKEPPASPSSTHRGV